MEVCAKCSRKCLYGKKCSQSPKVSSFFKVMIGTRFSDLLFLPPKFAKTLSLYDGKTMLLKDSTGRKWSVLVADINGGFAFKRGWREFSVAHGIELGDFVVFHYFVNSPEFTVQIFDRSACEKEVFSAGKNDKNKKMKTSRHASDLLPVDYYPFCKTLPKKYSIDYGISQPNDDVLQRRDVREDYIRISSPEEEERALSNENIARGQNKETVRESPDDVSLMLDRNMSFSKEDVNEDIRYISMFEKPEKKTATKEIDIEGLLTEGYTFSKNEESYLLAKEYGSVPSIEIPPSSNMTQKPIEMPVKTEVLTPSVGSLGARDSEPFPNAPELRRTVLAVQDPPSSSLKESSNPGQTPTPTSMPTTQPFKKAGRPRGRPRGSKQKPKTEPIDVIDLSSAPIANITCSVCAGSGSFLELSEPLPIKAKKGKKVVFLRDPAGRTWFVIYDQSGGYNVLVSGWDAFRKANNIRKGNKCTFSALNVDDAIFAVTIS